MNRLLLVACLLFAVPSVLADGLPDIADASQDAMSAVDERTLGENIMRDIRAEPAYLDDPELVEYLDNLGSRLAQSSSNPSQSFEFFVIQDNSVNAFALPGGFVGVHTGLILTAESESELASVLSHEIAHVTQRHLARMISDSKKSTLTSLAALAVAILASRSNGQATQAALAAAQANSIQSQLNFTREHEQEADRVGLQILARAGFDVHAMPTFFERLQKSSRLYENNAPDYLRTHPITSERIADIQGRIQNAPYKLVPDSNDFLLLKQQLLASQGIPIEALKYFQSALRDKKYSNEAAHRFGLATALERVHRYREAQQELAKVRNSIGSNAIVETMEGRLLLDLGENKQALQHYRKTYLDYPDHLALLYDYAGALIDNHMPDAALKLVGDAIARHPKDDHLYSLQARAQAANGKNMLQHQAQAEAYYLQGNLPGAIDQLQLAAKAGDGDFYTRSSVDSRLKQLQAIAAEAAKGAKKKR